MLGILDSGIDRVVQLAQVCCNTLPPPPILAILAILRALLASYAKIAALNPQNVSKLGIVIY